MDSGALGNNLYEKDLNLKISKYLYNRLKELNIPVVLTREDDEYLPRSDRIKRINNIVRQNPNKNIILLSNHMNAGGGDGQSVTNIKYNN